MNAEHAPDAHSGPSDGAGYETRDASVPALLKFGGGLIVSLVVVQFVMLGIYRVFVAERPEAIKPPTTTNLYQQLRDLHHDEDTKLKNYGWVDRKAGVVRIPIDRAIELLAVRGVGFGKGPKSELEMNSHAGSVVPAAEMAKEKDPTTPPDRTGPKP
jgi:hypothetical protein